MELRVFAQAVRKSWWLIVVFVLLGAGYGTFKNAHAAKVYESTLTLYVSINAGSQPSAGSISDDQSAQRRASSYVVLASSQRLANLIVSNSTTPLTTKQVMSSISASAQANTVLLDVAVEDTSPPRSLAIAQGVARNFPQLVIDLDDRGARTPAITLEVVSGPTLHAAPISPKKKLNLALGLIGGLLIGLVGAVLRELLDTAVRSTDALRRLSGLAVIGATSYDRAAKKAPLVTGERSRSVRAEQYRQIRTNITFASVDKPPRVIVVTSAISGEGKSMTTANLALTMAESGARVLLVEADLRRPNVARYLGLEGAVGLTDVLAGQAALGSVLQRWDDFLTVLPSGSLPPNPSELLGSQNMGDLLATLRNQFDVILLDTPPLLPVTDAGVAAALADGVILVVRYGRTTAAQVESAVDVLRGLDVAVIGAVLNMQPTKRSLWHRGRNPQTYYAASGPISSSTTRVAPAGDAAGLGPAWPEATGKAVSIGAAEPDPADQLPG